MRLRKVSAGNMNGTFLKDGEEDSKVTNRGKSVEETNQGKSAEDQEEMNTTYSLADVSVIMCALKNTNLN